MLFCDYTKTKVVYHIAKITDYEKIVTEGIKYDDKDTYLSKYIQFHKYFDTHKPPCIPYWVQRHKAIFASLNYRSNPNFHSHSVVLSIKIKPESCWIANENRANQLYEPFILKDTQEFKKAKYYINTKGKAMVLKYWKTSISFVDNLKVRKDLMTNYDAEVLIFHSIPPEDIRPLFIISDHRIMTLQQWKKCFCM